MEESPRWLLTKDKIYTTSLVLIKIARRNGLNLSKKDVIEKLMEVSGILFKNCYKNELQTIFKINGKSTYKKTYKCQKSSVLAQKIYCIIL